MLDLESLLRIPHVDPDYGFGLSPEGARIAFAYNLSGQWEIHLLSLDGSLSPRQITSGPGAKFAPRWSPDGHRLAYALDLDGSEAFDVWVYDFASGQHVNLTPDSDDSLQPNFAWSPDSSRIAFISNQSGRFDTYLMPSTGGEPRLVFGAANPNGKVRWSPDGQWLAVETEARGQDYATFLVSVSSGKPWPIAPQGEWLPAKDAAWSPDSKWVAFSSNQAGFYQIGLYALATAEVTWVTDGEGDKEQPAWSADGRYLAYVVGNGPENALAVLDLREGQVAIYRVAPGVHYRPRFTPDGDQLIFVFDNPSRPSDLWSQALRPGRSLGPSRAGSGAVPVDGPVRQLTNSLPVGLQQPPFAMPVEVRYPSLDGQMVPALRYRPASSIGPPPAVIAVHGGPNWLAQVTWDPLVQHMVSRGWVVLAPNYRGSTGYGRDWQWANRFDLGGGDAGDVVAGADYLVRKGWADPARIAVTGRSYGGYLTMTCLTRFPERWAGGSAVVPFLNWFTGHANSRVDLQHWDLENFGHPERDRELYYERSPFFFLDRVAAPVQLISGAHDPRCPASESTQARDRLAALGKRCELVLYPDEGHTFLKTENMVDARRRQVAFLAAVLAGWQ